MINWSKELYKRYRKVGFDFIFLLISRIMVGIIGLGVLQLLSKNFSPEMLGVYGSIFSVQIFVVTLVDLGITSTLARIGAEYLLKDERLTYAYFTVAKRKRDRIAAYLSFFGVILSPFITWLLFNDMADVLVVGLSFGMLIPLTYLSSTYIGVLVTFRRFKDQGAASLIQAFIVYFGLLLLSFVGSFALWQVFVLHIFAATFYLLYLRRLIPKSYFQRQEYVHLIEEYDREIKRVSNSRSVISVMNAMDQPMGYVLINRLSTPYDAGLYYAATTITKALTIFTEVISTVLLPRAAELTGNINGIRSFLQRLKLLIPVAVSAAVGMLIAIPFLIEHFLAPQYQKSLELSWILLLAYLPGMVLMPLSLMLFPLKMEYYQMLVSVGMFFVLLVLRLILIPSYGAIGMASSILVGKLIAWTLLVFLVWIGFRKMGAG